MELYHGNKRKTKTQPVIGHLKANSVGRWVPTQS